MTNLLNDLKSAASKRAAYVRTVREIRNMPLNVALDVGIFREDAHELAHKAVYGV